MSRHAEQATLSYSADELFAVVADVKHYPLFVPWCSGAHIRRADEREIIAELVIGFGPFQETFTSQVALDRPRQVRVRAVEGGPLERLTNTWTFTPLGDKTYVDFVIDFEFRESSPQSRCQWDVSGGRNSHGECVPVSDALGPRDATAGDAAFYRCKVATARCLETRRDRCWLLLPWGSAAQPAEHNSDSARPSCWRDSGSSGCSDRRRVGPRGRRVTRPD